MTKIYEDKIEDKNYSGSGVFVETADDGSGVTSINGQDGSVVVTINNVNNQANVNLGIDGSSIPLTSPSSPDDNVPTISEKVSEIAADVESNTDRITAIGSNVATLDNIVIGLEESVATKKSVDRLVVGQDPAKTILNNSITLDVGSPTTNGLTGDVKNQTGGVNSTLELKTADCVPKKFIVKNMYTGDPQSIQANATYPYKFVSSDDTISITNTNTIGEIDFKALDNPLDRNFTFSESLTTLVSKMIIGFEPTQNYFQDPQKRFDFTLKSLIDAEPLTSDLYMIVYYSDYMNRFPSKFPSWQGIFYLEGVPTENPSGDLSEMMRIYTTQEERNGKTMVDLKIAVLGQNGHTYGYQLNVDQTETEYTGKKIKINLSDKWRNTGLSLSKGSFNAYTKQTAINPFDYSVICGHIYFTFQYKA